MATTKPQQPTLEGAHKGSKKRGLELKLPLSTAAAPKGRTPGALVGANGELTVESVLAGIDAACAKLTKAGTEAGNSALQRYEEAEQVVLKKAKADHTRTVQMLQQATDALASAQDQHAKVEEDIKHEVDQLKASMASQAKSNAALLKQALAAALQEVDAIKAQCGIKG